MRKILRHLSGEAKRERIKEMDEKFTSFLDQARKRAEITVSEVENIIEVKTTAGRTPIAITRSGDQYEFRFCSGEIRSIKNPERLVHFMNWILTQHFDITQL